MTVYVLCQLLSKYYNKVVICEGVLCMRSFYMQTKKDLLF